MKNRFGFIMGVVVVMFSILVFVYARLTLVEGAKYRELSDNKRVRTITTTPPRGEIKDRNGVLLAGNKASFTVQILKDGLNSLELEEKNKVSLELVKLLEEDGVDYLNDFPVNLNTLRFIDESLTTGNSPAEEMVNVIIENNLIKELFMADYEEYLDSSAYRFVIGERILKHISEKEGDIPIEFHKSKEAFNLVFKEDIDMEDWFIKHGIDKIDDPYLLVLDYIKRDNNFLKKVFTNAVARKEVYDMLKEHGFIPNIEIIDYTLSFDDDKIAQKRYLSTKSEKININTSATDDFLALLEEHAMDIFLDKIIQDDSGRRPLSIQREMSIFLEDKGIDPIIKVTVSPKGDYNQYDSLKSIGDIEPKDHLLTLITENGLLKEFVTSDRIKRIAQSSILEAGINPRISIAEKEFEYVYVNEKRNWLSGEDINEKNLSPKELFELLRKNYKIPEDIDNYEARSMLSIYQLVKSRGYLAYQPINFAYGVSDKTVARLREGFGNKKGIQISVEPVRYYPFNQVGSHILGYIGKISQDGEIKEFVDEKGYQKSDLIGKTGLEHAFEDVLRGTPGRKVIEVDAYGYTTSELEEESGVQGNTIYTTADIMLQKYAEEKLIETMKAIRTAGTYESEWGDYKYDVDPKTKETYPANTGVVVVQKVKTGEILTMASVPSFNPNLFATGISSEDFQSLFPEHEEDQLAPRPLYNIATQTAIQPGSIFKMITALSALDKGMSPNFRIRDLGQVWVGAQPFSCWYYLQYGGALHGAMNLSDAIKNSCNYYFYSLALGENQRSGERIPVRITIDDITSMAKKFGMNDRTGLEIRIPAEAYGGVPVPERKAALQKSLLNRFLRRDLKKYVKNRDIFNEEEAITEIISWMDYETELTRNGVIKKLDELGLEATVPLEGHRDPLCDIIKYTHLKDAKWNIADTLNVTIGQGQNSYTPVQISNYISTLANGGDLYKLTLIDSIRNSKGLLIEKNEPEFTRVELKDYKSLDDVKAGMVDSVKTGYIKNMFNGFPIDVAAKTGSAEKAGINPATGKEYTAFAWFVAYAPADDPEIAVTSLIFQGRTGSNAGPMTRDIIAKYFNLENTSEIVPEGEMVITE